MQGKREIMNYSRDEIILAIARRNSLTRGQRYHGRYPLIYADTLDSTQTSADSYEVSVDGVRKALEEAWEAGRKSVEVEK